MISLWILREIPVSASDEITSKIADPEVESSPAICGSILDHVENIRTDSPV